MKLFHFLSFLFTFPGYVIVLLYYSLIVLLYYSLIVLLYYSLIVLLYYSLIVLLYYSLIYHFLKCLNINYTSQLTENGMNLKTTLSSKFLVS